MMGKMDIFELEPRIMFDAAGSTVAEACVVATAEPVSADMFTNVQNTDVISGNKLDDAIAQANGEIASFMRRDDALDQLRFLFGGEDTQGWNDKAQALRTQFLDGDYSIQITTLEGSSMGIGTGAYAAEGVDAIPTVYINADWMEGAGEDALTRVIIEEMGHSFDTVLNGEADTVGDEGERFAVVVTGGVLDATVGTDNDHAIISVDGENIDVELASYRFVNVYKVNTETTVAGKESNTHDFIYTSLGAPTVNDMTGNYNFSGNDLSVTSINIDANGDGNSETYYGWISRPIKVGGQVKGFYFWTDADFTTLEAAQNDGNSDGDRNETDNSGFILVVDQAYFTAAFGNENGSIQNIGSSSDRVDSALNALLVPNSAPTPANDTLSVQEDTTNNAGNLLANDTDPNNDTLSITGFTINGVSGTLAQPTAIAGVGTITINADGSYIFTPNVNYAGNLPLITYTVSDGTATASANLSISITDVNDAPAGTDKTITAKENQSYTFSADDFGFTDPTDSPSDTLSAVQITSLPTAGTLTLNGFAVNAGDLIALADITKLKFTPALNATGNAYAAFTFQVKDNGGIANGGIDLDPTPNTITFNLTNANSAPTAVSDTATAIEAGGLNNATAGNNPSGNVLSNDTDPDSGDTKTVVSASGVETATVGIDTQIAGLYGTLSISDTGGYTYTLDNDNPTVQALLLSTDTLTDTFSYTMKDGGGVISSSTLSVTITGANDAPVAVNDYDALQEGALSGGYYGTTTGNVLTNDTDVDSDTSLITAIEGQGITTLSIDFGGSANSIKSKAGDVTEVQVSNGSGGWITLTSNGANVTVESFTGSGNTLSVILSDPAALNGYIAPQQMQIVLSGGSTYTGTYTGSTTTAGSSATVAPSSEGVVTGKYGSLTINSTGGYTYNITDNTLNLGQTYTEQFTYTITSGGQTDTAALYITVSGTTTTVLADDFLSVAEDSGAIISGNVSLLSNDTGTSSVTSFSWNGVTATAGESITLNGVGILTIASDGAITFDPVDNYIGLVPVVTYTAVDGSGYAASANLSITITPSNDAPVVADDTATAYEAGGIANAIAGLNPTGSVLLNDTDVDGDTLSVTAGTFVGSYGTLVLNSNGTYTYTLDNTNATVQALNSSSAPLTESFTYTLSDGTLTDTATLSILINGANDVPLNSMSGTPSVAEGGVVAISTVSVSDVDNDNLSVTLSVLNGTLTMAAAEYTAVSTSAGNGTSTITLSGTKTSINAALATLSYSGNTDFNGIDTLTVETNDGALSDTDTLDIAVTPDNRALSVTGTTVNEASPYVLFEVTGVSGQKVTLSLSDGSATAGADFSPNLEYYDGSAWVAYAGGAVAIPSGSATLLVRSAVFQDTISEGSETLTLSAANKYGTLTTATSTIKDDGLGSIYLGDNTTLTANTAVDAGYPTHLDDDRAITINSISVNESSPYGVFTLTGAIGQKVQLALHNMTATVGTDTGAGLEYYNGSEWVNYTADSTLTLASSTLLVRTTITQDSTFEGQESFALAVTKVSAEDTTVYGVGSIYDDGTGDIYLADNTSGSADTSGTGYPTSKDDDRTLAVDSPTVNEASNIVVYTLSGNSGQTVSLSLVNESDNATVIGKANVNTAQTLKYWDGLDWVNYNPDNLPTFDANGKIFVSVDITDEQDTQFEGSETFKLNATLSGQSIVINGTVTINDDGTGVKYDGTLTSGLPTTITTALDNDTPINDAPTAGNGTLVTNEDTAKTSTLPTATDREGDSVSYAKATDPSHGTVSVNTDGSYTYTPDANYSGSDSFTYTVSDGQGGTNTYTVAITVNEVSSPEPETVLPLYIPEAPILPAYPTDSAVPIANVYQPVVIDAIKIDLNTERVIAESIANLEVNEVIYQAQADDNSQPFKNENFKELYVDKVGRLVLDFSGQIEFAKNSILEVRALQMDKNLIRVMVKDSEYQEGDARFEMFLIDGTIAPEWIKIDPSTGLITGVPPVGTDRLVVQVKIIGKDGKAKSVDVEINVNNTKVSNNGLFSNQLEYLSHHNNSTSELLHILNQQKIKG
jgi:VCBS repeat-containing protein